MPFQEDIWSIPKGTKVLFPTSVLKTVLHNHKDVEFPDNIRVTIKADRFTAEVVDNPPLDDNSTSPDDSSTSPDDTNSRPSPDDSSRNVCSACKGEKYQKGQHAKEDKNEDKISSTLVEKFQEESRKESKTKAIPYKLGPIFRVAFIRHGLSVNNFFNDMMREQHTKPVRYLKTAVEGLKSSFRHESIMAVDPSIVEIEKCSAAVLAGVQENYDSDGIKKGTGTTSSTNNAGDGVSPVTSKSRNPWWNYYDTHPGAIRSRLIFSSQKRTLETAAVVAGALLKSDIGKSHQPTRDALEEMVRNPIAVSSLQEQSFGSGNCRDYIQADADFNGYKECFDQNGKWHGGVTTKGESYDRHKWASCRETQFIGMSGSYVSQHDQAISDAEDAISKLRAMALPDSMLRAIAKGKAEQPLSAAKGEEDIKNGMKDSDRIVVDPLGVLRNASLKLSPSYAGGPCMWTVRQYEGYRDQIQRFLAQDLPHEVDIMIRGGETVSEETVSETIEKGKVRLKTEEPLKDDDTSSDKSASDSKNSPHPLMVVSGHSLWLSKFGLEFLVNGDLLKVDVDDDNKNVSLVNLSEGPIVNPIVNRDGKTNSNTDCNTECTDKEDPEDLKKNIEKDVWTNLEDDLNDADKDENDNKESDDEESDEPISFLERRESASFVEINKRERAGCCTKNRVEDIHKPNNGRPAIHDSTMSMHDVMSDLISVEAISDEHEGISDNGTTKPTRLHSGINKGVSDVSGVSSGLASGHASGHFTGQGLRQADYEIMDSQLTDRNFLVVQGTSANHLVPHLQDEEVPITLVSGADTHTKDGADGNDDPHTTKREGDTHTKDNTEDAGQGDEGSHILEGRMANCAVVGMEVRIATPVEYGYEFCTLHSALWLGDLNREDVNSVTFRHFTDGYSLFQYGGDTNLLREYYSEIPVSRYKGATFLEKSDHDVVYPDVDKEKKTVYYSDELKETESFIANMESEKTMESETESNRNIGAAKEAFIEIQEEKEVQNLSQPRHSTAPRKFVGSRSRVSHSIDKVQTNTKSTLSFLQPEIIPETQREINFMEEQEVARRQREILQERLFGLKRDSNSYQSRTDAMVTEISETISGTPGLRKSVSVEIAEETALRSGMEMGSGTGPHTARSKREDYSKTRYSLHNIRGLAPERAIFGVGGPRCTRTPQTDTGFHFDFQIFSSAYCYICKKYSQPFLLYRPSESAILSRGEKFLRKKKDKTDTFSTVFPPFRKWIRGKPEENR